MSAGWLPTAAYGLAATRNCCHRSTTASMVVPSKPHKTSCWTDGKYQHQHRCCDAPVHAAKAQLCIGSPAYSPWVKLQWVLGWGWLLWWLRHLRWNGQAEQQGSEAQSVYVYKFVSARPSGDQVCKEKGCADTELCNDIVMFAEGGIMGHARSQA